MERYKFKLFAIGAVIEAAQQTFDEHKCGSKRCRLQCRKSFDSYRRENFETNNGCNLNFNYSHWLVARQCEIFSVDSIDMRHHEKWTQLWEYVWAQFKPHVISQLGVLAAHAIHHPTRSLNAIRLFRSHRSRRSVRSSRIVPSALNHLLFMLNWISKRIEFEKGERDERKKWQANRSANQKLPRTKPSSAMWGSNGERRETVCLCRCQFQLSSGT